MNPFEAMTVNNKKVLIVCQEYPLPDNHGNPMRTMNFVRFFKEKFKDKCELDIAFWNGKNGYKTGPFANEFVFAPKTLRTGMASKIARLRKDLPAPICDFDKNTKKGFTILLEARKYDYILFRYLLSTQLGFDMPEQFKKKTIVDFDDIISDSLYDLQVHSDKRVHANWMVSGERFLLRRYERKCLNFGAALFCSQNDLSLVQNGGGNKNAFIVPNVYDKGKPGAFHYTDGYINGSTLLFVGSLDYPPDIEGLIWFVENIFQDFKQEFTDAKLLVAGRSPIEAVRNFCAKDSKIELYPDVPDLRPFYEKCRAVVVPILAGGGARLKILEAATSCRPVLATPAGASGFDFKDGFEISIFENPAEFMTHYRQLSTHERYMKMVENAWNLVKNRHSGMNFYTAMESTLRHIDIQVNPYCIR